MKKILILGSSGLVGSATKEIFNLEDNFKVLSPLRREVDLFSPLEISKFIDDNEPDWIINCAAKVGGIVANNTYRTEFLIENLKINMNILEACIKRPSINIVNLGSSCIYPLNAANPITENSFMNGKLEPTNSPYALAKITAIELGKEIKYQYGNKIINLMPTNLYGPRDNFSAQDSHVIPGLISRFHIDKIHEKETIVYGDGEPLRQFLYAKDFANLILKVLLEENYEGNGSIICCNDEVKISSMVDVLIDVMEMDKEKVSYDTNMPNGCMKKTVCNAKLKSIYPDFKFTSLKDGLKETYTWFKENYPKNIRF